MPANKNALIRYKTIDNCLRNRFRQFSEMADVVRRLQDKLAISSKLIRENSEDGSCIFQIEVVINFEMYSVFMSYGTGLKVIYPRTAVAYMRDKTHEMADMYERFV